MATHAAFLLHTPRLWLEASDVSLAPAVADFYQRNAAHFAPWDPPLPPDHASLHKVQQALQDGHDAFTAGTALRWWLTDSALPSRVLGSVHLSGVVRGAFHSALLGYSLDAQCQGQGLMTEALQAVLAEAFGPRIGLHRLQAAVRPENQRSLAVMQRLGFAQEGLARSYLYIDGAWRDHLIFARLNPGFEVPAHWRR